MKQETGKGRITYDGDRVVGVEVWPEGGAYFVWVDPEYMNANLREIKEMVR